MIKRGGLQCKGRVATLARGAKLMVAGPLQPLQPLQCNPRIAPRTFRVVDLSEGAASRARAREYPPLPQKIGEAVDAASRARAREYPRGVSSTLSMIGTPPLAHARESIRRAAFQRIEKLGRLSRTRARVWTCMTAGVLSLNLETPIMMKGVSPMFVRLQIWVSIMCNPLASRARAREYPYRDVSTEVPQMPPLAHARESIPAVSCTICARWFRAASRARAREYPLFRGPRFENSYGLSGQIGSVLIASAIF